MRFPRLRSGLSLAELTVVIALLGLIGAAVASALLHQQRFHDDASGLLHAREGVRDAMEVLSTDIRGSSAADTIRLMADSAIELFTGIGTSVVCRAVSSSAFVLAEESAGGNTLSSFLVEPDTGDIVLLYMDTADAAGTGSHWDGHRIAAFTATGTSPGCLLDDTNPREGFALTLQSPADRRVRRGGPVRFVRRGRYSLYRSSDNEWYLGYRRCNAIGPSVCGAIQPVSGPYRRYSSDGLKTGFLFEYFDAFGEVVTDAGSPLSVARIDITARAERMRARRFGSAGRSIGDSAFTSIAIRNR